MESKPVFIHLSKAPDHAVRNLYMRMSSPEMAEHLRARAKHHADRATAKEAELPKLEESIEVIKSGRAEAGVAHMNKMSSNYRFDGDDAIEQLKADIKDHKNKATVFDWMAAHLLPNDYVLDESDLIRLEITKAR